MTQEFEEKYRSILSNIEELYYEVDLLGNLTFFNNSMAKILGYSEEELMGMNNRQYMSPETARRVYQTFNQVYRTGIPTKAFDWELIGKDGTIRVLETSVSLMHDPDGQPAGFYGIGRDITERKQTERELKAREEKYRSILSNIEELYYEVDLAGNLTFLNGSMVRILGYSNEELMGMNNRQYMSPETAGRVYQTFNQVYRTGIPTKAFDWELIGKDGTIRVLETSVSLMHDPNGQPAGFYGIGRDITERKQTEEHEKSVRRAKDKAFHQLSHELRTPLAIIQGISRILKKKLQMPSSYLEEGGLFAIWEHQLNRLLDIQLKTENIIRYDRNFEEGSIDKEFERLYERIEKRPEIPRHLVTELKELNNKISQYLPSNFIDSKAVHLSALIQDVLDRTKQLTKHRTLLLFTKGKDNLYILMDPKIMEEIFEGLLKNAIENTPDEGMIQIILETNEGKVFLKVQDFGIGITGENQKYIFDGLFSTREMELYSSRKPYDFYAGGKGLDLFKMKVYSQKFGFNISVESQRCMYLPTDQHLCPGRISLCSHCGETSHCYSSGGSTFCVSFPLLEHRESTA